MSDRIYAFTVILDAEYQEESADNIRNAIGMIKGVSDVTEHIADPSSYFAKQTAMIEIRKKMIDVLYPEEK